jgi:hypothetical protein
VVTSKQNVDPGFSDTVCIKCSNAAGSTVTYDNWTVAQKPNCETLAAQSLADKVYDYDTSATSTLVYSSNDAFSNSKASDCPVLSCTLKQTGCSNALVAPFSNLLSLDAAFPFGIKVSQT